MTTALPSLPYAFAKRHGVLLLADAGIGTGSDADGAAAQIGLREGALRPLVSRRYPLSQAPAALEALLAREAVGKLVVLPQLAG